MQIVKSPILETALTVPKKQPSWPSLWSSRPLKCAIFVSPRGVRSIWLWRDLKSFKKRRSAPQRHVAETGEVLTEAQVVALEKKQEDDVAHGEIETAHRTQSLTAQALWRAVRNKRPTAELIHHSDRGSQYCAEDCVAWRPRSSSGTVRLPGITVAPLPRLAVLTY